MNKKTIDIGVKIVLTLLAIASGIVAFALQFTGRSSVLSSVYGVLYFVMAISFWLQDKKLWLRLIMFITLVTTLIMTISQSIAGIPLGIYQGSLFAFSWLIVLLAAPGILGLIYFNLNTQHNNWDLLVVFMKIILNFEAGITALMLIMMLEISGAMIWSLPKWGQYVFVYGIMLLAILDVIYAIINWLKFYRGKVAWITTIIFMIEIITCMPLLGMPDVPMIIFIIVMLIVAAFTAYLNNRIKK